MSGPSAAWNLPTISTRPSDRIIENSRRKGALAGKVCGAGGGGCVVLLIEPDGAGTRGKGRRGVRRELLPMQIDRQGVTVVTQ